LQQFNDDLEGVMVVGATNHPEALEDAARRRFGIIIFGIVDFL